MVLVQISNVGSLWNIWSPLVYFNMTKMEIDNAVQLNLSLSGPNATHVKLISDDGHEFILPKDLVMISSTLRDMIAGPGQVLDEDEINEVILKDIKSHILREICNYLQYKDYYDNSDAEMPYFYVNVPEHALLMLFAAEFLNC
ncbi:Elongin-C [Aphelenchoides besseyi]|nr:Elongin-C [Aphelenchoides besseyi]KAI6218596.1 Elongin-C [Aphelenchoides besseyi]